MNNQTKNQAEISHTALLHEANEFVKKGDYENFLAYCTEDTRWIFIGERILSGREEVKNYMKEFYREPPVFSVDTTVESGDFLAVTGEITLKDKNGTGHHYDYCDVWRFENGKIAALKAYVIEKKS
ncbi:nuclear transport factor 2 family protein [uncultured Chryseobacterium sp.]|uniref:nuclear transport factor 2 family protein n=1 Tax=uncultured Chryseobacterium sp. TaxID=259322 RepID=UPI0025FE35D5|nr:nuclear transport factor 2 family protein [uncultured Chryseobacterium sp.]